MLDRREIVSIVSLGNSVSIENRLPLNSALLPNLDACNVLGKDQPYQQNTFALPPRKPNHSRVTLAGYMARARLDLTVEHTRKSQGKTGTQKAPPWQEDATHVRMKTREKTTDDQGSQCRAGRPKSYSASRSVTASGLTGFGVAWASMG